MKQKMGGKQNESLLTEEGDVYLVRLEGHCVLRAPSPKSDIIPNEPIKDSNVWKVSKIDQSKGRL